MTTALIADDEPHLSRHLQEQLLDLWPALQIVHVARNGLEAAQQLARLQPDLAFLDIKMPGLDGLQVAQGVEAATRIVFVTAYDEFAVRAFDQEAFDYVLKPVQRERLQRTVERLQRAMGDTAAATSDDDRRLAAVLQRLLPAPPAAARHLRYVRASRGELTVQVDVDDVLCFQADEKYTSVLTATAEHLIRTPIAELVAMLDPAQFCQIHRSTLVNLRHVASTRRDEASRLFVRLRGLERELPVSRAYVAMFKGM